MATRFSDASTRPLSLAALVLFLAMAGSLIITRTTAEISLVAALLIVLLFASFLIPEFGLHIILLSMLLSPEIVVGGVGGISLGKPTVKADVLVVRIEDLVLVAVAFAWLARTAIFKELAVIRRTPINPAILSYVAALILATLLGAFAGTVRPVRGFFFTLKYLEYFVVYFMTVNLVREQRQLLRLLTTAFATCAISALVGIMQIPSGERVAAPFEGQYGEPNTFGGYLVLMLALVLAHALSSQSPTSLLRWGGFACLLVVPLLFTLSRSSWLACIPMLLTLIVLSPRRLTLVIGLGVALLLGAPFLPKQVVDRYNYTLNASVDRGEYRIGEARLDTSTSARLESWKLGFTAWTRRPVLGYGVTGYGFIDAQFIRVLVESGLIGMAAFLWLLWRMFRVAWQAHTQVAGSGLERISLGYLAALAAMVMHAVSANTFIIVRIMEPLWFLTGIVAVLPLLSTPEKRVAAPAPLPR